MEDQYIVMKEKMLPARSILEDDMPRVGGRLPEYAHTITVCIDSFDDGLVSGRLYNFYCTDVSTFKSLDQLIFAMEDLMDKVHHPAAWMEINKPSKKRKRKKKEQPEEEVIAEMQNPIHTLPSFEVAPGKLMSLYIRVLYRQNASMQGVVKFVGNTEQYTFRSDLELMWIIRDMLEHPELISGQ